MAERSPLRVDWLMLVPFTTAASVRTRNEASATTAATTTTRTTTRFMRRACYRLALLPPNRQRGASRTGRRRPVRHEGGEELDQHVGRPLLRVEGHDQLVQLLAVGGV